MGSLGPFKYLSPYLPQIAGGPSMLLFLLCPKRGGPQKSPSLCMCPSMRNVGIFGRCFLLEIPFFLAMIAENLKLVQLKLDQADSEARMRLQNQNEDLTKEVNLLRKKLETAQESYHKSVQAWEAAELDLRSKNDTLKESEAKAKSQVDELNNSIGKNNENIS